MGTGENKWNNKVRRLLIRTFYRSPIGLCAKIARCRRSFQEHGILRFRHCRNLPVSNTRRIILNFQLEVIGKSAWINTINTNTMNTNTRALNMPKNCNCDLQLKKALKKVRNQRGFVVSRPKNRLLKISCYSPFKKENPTGKRPYRRMWDFWPGKYLIGW